MTEGAALGFRQQKAGDKISEKQLQNGESNSGRRGNWKRCPLCVKSPIATLTEQGAG
jgi:hypothetical protein